MALPRSSLMTTSGMCLNNFLTSASSASYDRERTTTVRSRSSSGCDLCGNQISGAPRHRRDVVPL